MQPIINTHYTKEEHKEAMKAAANYIFTPFWYIKQRAFKHDARTRIGQLSNMYVKKYVHLRTNEVINKQKQRHSNKGAKEFENIFNNAITKDYLTNKRQLKRVAKDKLEFFGRNHYAKNEQDYKILAILGRFI